jgi:hypothetical protein
MERAVAEVVAEDAPVRLLDVPLAVADLMDSHEEFREVEFTVEVEDVGMVAILKVDTIMEDIITVAIVDTFIEDMHQQVPSLEPFSVE